MPWHSPHYWNGVWGYLKGRHRRYVTIALGDTRACLSSRKQVNSHYHRIPLSHATSLFDCLLHHVSRAPVCVCAMNYRSGSRGHDGSQVVNVMVTGKVTVQVSERSAHTQTATHTLAARRFPQLGVTCLTFRVNCNASRRATGQPDYFPDTAFTITLLLCCCQHNSQ